ncbi:hypothetical protein BCR59_28085 [Klebsiella pneumoniae]|nr:hypothetical protein BCR59_28085 [Klebsiella pneumoniae]
MISLDAAQNMLAAQQKLEGLGGKVLLRMRQPDPRSTVLTPGIVEASAQIRAGKWDDQPAPFMGG